MRIIWRLPGQRALTTNNSSREEHAKKRGIYNAFTKMTFIKCNKGLILYRIPLKMSAFL